MERIIEMDRLKSLLKTYMKKGVQTNNYVLPASYQKPIASGCFYAVESSGALCLLTDMGAYYRLYYHLRHLNQPLALKPEIRKPVVAEIPFNKKQAADDIKCYLQTSGFSLAVTRDRLRALPEDFKVLPMRATVLKATAAMQDAIAAFLYNHFDPFTGFLPSKETLTADIEAGRILCTLDKSGAPTALLHYGLEGPVASLYHIAVDQSARGQGIARDLLHRWQVETLGSVKSYTIWVGTHNDTAKILYQKSGFLPDRWHCYTMLLP